MANKQINELTEKTTIVDADLIPIYDSEEAGSEKTKKITFANAIGYEEGTWTPVPADADTGGNTGSATVATGEYTKIGRQVTVVCRLNDINTTGLTAGNPFYIQGLPYEPMDGFAFTSAVATNSVTFSTGTDYTVNFFENNFAVRLAAFQTGTGSGVICIVSDIADDSGDIFFTFTYFTS